MVDTLVPIEPLVRAPRETWTHLAEVLRAGRYDDVILGQAESIAANQVDHLRVPLVRYELERRTDAAAALALLFTYHGAIRPERAREVLGEATLAALTELHVLVATERGIESAVRILPFWNTWIMSDELSQQGDPVMGPGRTTAQLADWMGSCAGQSVLDVGTGAGSLAVVAAKSGAARAVGVDISERAIAWLRVNCALNGVEVEGRVGDLFAPVAGERFDLVVAQPPFVIQPESEPSLTFLHGGRDGDELTMRLLDELGGHLKEGGRGLVLFQAPVRAGQALVERVTAALKRTCAAPALVLSVLGYLEAYNVAGVTAAETHAHFGPEYDRAAVGYLHALEARGIKRVVQALADVRSGAARPFSVLHAWKARAMVRAVHLEQARNAVQLMTLGDAELLRAPLRCRPGAQIAHTQSLTGDGEETLLLVFPTEPVMDRSVTPDVLSILQAIDGEGSLEAALRAIADDPAEVAPRVLPLIRDLVLAGVLLPR